MANYDLGCLSSQEFENLIRDLIQEDMGIFLESFTAGKDEGIDLRCLTNDNLIVQCKHYTNSSFSQLYSNLKLKEVPKVRKLNPNRYFLVTSVGLTPNNKKELKKLFEPYCKLDSDVFGKDDIFNLLNLHENIVRINYKLWFTSSVVLDETLKKIIQNEDYSKVKIDLDNFQAFIPKIVITNTFRELDEVLEKKNVCVICGIPGSGKTTMMKFFVMKYVKSGYQPILITENIKEAYRMYNPEEKQIFYYDDFLGQTFLEENFLKNEDSEISSFIERIKKQKNKKLIFSTREYILNQAEPKSEKVGTFNEFKYIIQLSNITIEDKAKILYNHLWHSEIKSQNINNILEKKLYMDIIKHPNFNPRIIEWMTTSKNVNCTNFADNFINSLNNPKKIWEHAFENQISEFSRILLLIMGTFPIAIDLGQLQEAFKNYISDLSSNTLEFPLLFKKSLKELDGTFIHTIMFHSSKIFIEFSNPSIRDFIHNYLLEESSYLSKICRKAISFTQIVQIWNVLENNIDLKRINEYIDLSVFIKTIKRIFEEGNSAVYLKLNLEDLSLENKIEKLLKIATSLYSAELIDYVTKKLELLTVKNYNNETNIKKLYDILLTVKKNEKLFSSGLNEFIKSSKYRIISENPTSIHDFYLVAKFLQNFGIAIDEKNFSDLENRLDLILSMGIDIDDEGGIFTYSPEEDCFYNVGYGVGDLEEIKNDLDIIFELFSSNSINFIRENIKEQIKDFDSNYKDYQDDTGEEMKVTDLEKEEFEIDDLFESLREKEDPSCH